MNNIKNISFTLENCEGVLVPFKCFKKFKVVENNKNADKLFILECLIEDNGEIEYTSTWMKNTTSPIQRLGRGDDITSIYITYDDDSTQRYSIPWYDYNPNSNKNQSSQMIDYKTVQIKIKPYIQKYSIVDVLNSKSGTKFKDINKNVYVVEEINKVKKLFSLNKINKTVLPLESTYINQEYIKLKS